MNDGNGFRVVGRSPHIDLAPLRADHGNTNYTASGDAHTTRISDVILWCSRFGVPIVRGAIAERLMELTALYRAHGPGLPSPG
jgi:hypothetical protein